jgi:hypothetical protein
VAQLPTVFDDLVVRDLEEKYIYALVKILLNNHDSDGWTGFVVHNNRHIIIMTVAHAVNAFNDSIICSGNTFRVMFYENSKMYIATAVEYDFKSDVLILRCDHPYPLVTTYFKFANINYEILSSRSVICISHPAMRDWTTLHGTVCRKPFRIGENQNNFDPEMLLIDHDIQKFSRSSGAPIINMTDEVIGINFSQVVVMEKSNQTYVILTNCKTNTHLQ